MFAVLNKDYAFFFKEKPEFGVSFGEHLLMRKEPISNSIHYKKI
jgi:hypothetical protein